MQGLDFKSLQSLVQPNTAPQLAYDPESYDISHLDYAYIALSTNTHELKFLLAKLRSGDEGSFPQLEEAAEYRIQTLDPSYHKSNTKKQSQCDAQVKSDLQDWMKSMMPAASVTAINPSSSINTTKYILSERERVKGNEAYRAKEYPEALEAYTRSIAHFPRAVVYSNRSLVHVAMKNDVLAQSDTAYVIEHDGDGSQPLLLKSLLRRGKANYSKAKYTLALEDFDRAFALGCEDAQAWKAKTLERLETVYPEGYGVNGVQTMRRMIIEEIEEPKLEVKEIIALAAEGPTDAVAGIEDECDLGQDVLDAMDAFAMSDDE